MILSSSVVFELIWKTLVILLAGLPVVVAAVQGLLGLILGADHGRKVVSKALQASRERRVQAALEATRPNTSLLRASAQPSGQQETLLRAATESAETSAPEELLRAVGQTEGRQT